MTEGVDWSGMIHEREDSPDARQKYESNNVRIKYQALRVSAH